MIKYSRQREAIKDYLSHTTAHPTAEQVYLAVRKEYPHISLGTVYRNLNLLVELGEIQKFSCGDGNDHFDYITSPHYHFVCRHCGKIIDIPMAARKELEEAAAMHIQGSIEEHTIFFYGICEECSHRTPQ